MKVEGGFAVFTLGLDDVAEPLEAAIAKTGL
jgi:hypothetical protein